MSWFNSPFKAQSIDLNPLMDSRPLVSVVTPFYNTKAYLAECIESVLRQTYENWEYVLVDNFSTDGSRAVADAYVSRFPGKIRLLQPASFLPQVQNYNFALAQISSESKYCKVVQADDWLFPDCIQSMVEVGEQHPTVGIVSAYELEGEDVRLGGLPYPSPESLGREIGRLYFLRRRYLFGSPTSLLMRSDLVRSRQPFYEERYSPFEDGHVCFELLKSCNFGFVHQVLTYTRRQPGSTISPLQTSELDLLIHFVMLVTHGRHYLNEKEYAACFALAQRRYFERIARFACGLRKRDPYFWEFHRKGLASVNYDLSWKTLIRWIPRALIEKTWDWLWAAWDRLRNNPAKDLGV